MSDDVQPSPDPTVRRPGASSFLAATVLAHEAVAAAAVPLLLAAPLSDAGVAFVLAVDLLAVLVLAGVGWWAVRGLRGRGAADPAVADRVLVAALTLVAVSTGLRTAATGAPWAGIDAALTLTALLAVRSTRLAQLSGAITIGAWVGGAASALTVAGAPVWIPAGRPLDGPAVLPSTVDWPALAQALVPGGVLLAVLVVVLGARTLLTGQEQELAGARLSAEQAAVEDPVTGAANRRGLQLVAAPMLEHARRQSEALHCLLLDVDDFRAVNESAGHDRGDEVLRAVVAALRASARGTDVVARWSDDEFVVLGPGTGTSPLEMERRVRAHLTEHPPLPQDVWAGRVSIGSATLVPWDDGDLNSLLRRADQDMQLRRTLRRQRTRKDDEAATPQREPVEEAGTEPRPER